MVSVGRNPTGIFKHWDPIGSSRSRAPFWEWQGCPGSRSHRSTPHCEGPQHWIFATGFSVTVGAGEDLPALCDGYAFRSNAASAITIRNATRIQDRFSTPFSSIILSVCIVPCLVLGSGTADTHRPNSRSSSKPWTSSRGPQLGLLKARFAHCVSAICARCWYFWEKPLKCGACPAPT